MLVGLVGGWVVDARPASAAARLLLQHGALGEEPDLGEAQEDQAEDWLRGTEPT